MSFTVGFKVSHLTLVRYCHLLSPTLSVKRRLWDEADDDLSYEESDDHDGLPYEESSDGLSYQPSLEPAPVNIASVNVSVMALWTTCQQR